jgi:hypothetical protein
MDKYKQNLNVIGDKVYSYNTHVATINETQLIQLGWWSVTTQKHINYVAQELNLTLIKNNSTFDKNLEKYRDFI